MEIGESYIEKAWGDSIDEPTMEDIRVAIQETIEMDDEHGAFWVSVGEGMPILETHKDLTVIAVYGEGEEVRHKLKSWAEVERMYEGLLARDINTVQAVLAAK
jgi:hypothetical protein